MRHTTYSLLILQLHINELDSQTLQLFYQLPIVFIYRLLQIWRTFPTKDKLK